MRGLTTPRRPPGGEFPLQPPGPRPASFPGCLGAAAPGPDNSPVHRAGCRPYGRSMHSADGRAADADGERAETYLRLAAEAALRSTEQGRPDQVRNAADVLVDAGVLADTVAAQIITDLNVALRVRGRRSALGLQARLRGMSPLRPGQRLALHRPGEEFEPSGGLAPPWRVLPAGPGTSASRLMALILMADRALVPATVFFPPSDGPADSETPPFAQLTGTDDAGTEYRLGFSDGTWAGSAWTGTVIFVPAPPAAARWLSIISPNGPLLRADIRSAPPVVAPPRPVVGPVPETPGERLLTRRAEAMLAANALGYPVERGQPGPCEAVAALEGAGVLAPLSAAPARLAALGQLLGLATEGPADEVPGRWTAVITHYGRRRRLTPVAGTAAIAAELPEIDGARFALAGLRSGGEGTFLHVLVDGLRRPVTLRRPGPPADIGFSWWLRDDADGWHLGAAESVSPVGGREGMLRLALLPPLGHAATALTAEIRGATQQVTATLPVRW
jgi:hypothetical protein